MYSLCGVCATLSPCQCQHYRWCVCRFTAASGGVGAVPPLTVRSSLAFATIRKRRSGLRRHLRFARQGGFTPAALACGVRALHSPGLLLRPYGPHKGNGGAAPFPLIIPIPPPGEISPRPTFGAAPFLRGLNLKFAMLANL